MRRAVLLAGLVSARAHAQPSEADRLFEAGHQLADKGDYAGACAQFTASYKLDPAVGTELNIADCEEHLGHLRAAWEAYLAAGMQFERGGEAKRAAYAREHADAIAARLATIVIDVADPKSLAITIGGRTVTPQREIRDRVEPGEIAIVASAPGHPPFQTTVHVAAGETALVAIPGFEPPAKTHALSWGLAAAAGATVATSIVLGLVARGRYDDAASGPHCTKASGSLVCDGFGAQQIHDAQSLGTLGTGLFFGGAALGGFSIYLRF